MVKVQLMTTPGCGHCEKVKRILEKLKSEFPSLEVEIIDLVQNPELIEKYQIMSTPGVVIKGKLEFMGGASEQQLREKLKEFEEA